MMNDATMKEKADVLRNDLRLRNQGSTLSQFAQSDAATSLARYAAISSPQVVGSTPIPKYEGAPNWAHDPVPTEPPLGFDNPALEPSPEPHAPFSEALATEPDPVPPLVGQSERSGSFSPRAYRRF